jgi:hypothetical protein
MFRVQIVKQEGAMDSERQRLTFEVMKHYSEIWFKVLGYLFAAHGAGLAGSLSILKDYKAVPQYKGVGDFIGIFAAGLVFTVVSHIAALLDDTKKMDGLLEGKDPREIRSKRINDAVVIGTMFSLMMFGFALVKIFYLSFFL